MAQLRQNYQKYLNRDTEIIAVGPEQAREFTTWWHANKMPFIGIPDPQHKIARLYGQKVNVLKFGRLPALVVIGKDGNIYFSHYGDSTADIVSDEEVISILDKLNKSNNKA